jgi:ParB family transcriptional regulator, chromosome partitioning protein
LNVNRERRLGRGLEALLGQIPVRDETAQSIEQPEHSQLAPSLSGDASVQTPTPTVPSAESLFRLDIPHTTPGEFFAQPHHSPAQVSATPAAAASPAASASAAVSTTAAVSAAFDSLAGHEAPIASETPARISVRMIDSNPSQPRQEFDPSEMRSLAESISSHGLLQPVVVRRVQDRYQLVAGERRLRAAIQAGWVDVPVNVIEADDRQMAELAIVENLHRKDLNALEKAASFQKHLEQYGCTQEELAGRLKLDRSTIANLIRLLELPETVQEAIRRGKITQGHARALLPLGDEREQVEFCGRIQREGLNVRQTEAMVQEIIDSADRDPLTAVEAPTKRTRSSRAKSENIAALEQQFRTVLGMKVKITHNARGRGKLVVQFRDHEEFEQLKRHICGS